MWASFVKLSNGDWGIKVEGKGIRPGLVVDVTRKDGSIHKIRLGQVTKISKETYYCTIAKQQSARPEPPRKLFDDQLLSQPSSNSRKHEIPPDDGSIPFDPPYKYISR
jgi:hypothetical protein